MKAVLFSVLMIIYITVTYTELSNENSAKQTRLQKEMFFKHLNKGDHRRWSKKIGSHRINSIRKIIQSRRGLKKREQCQNESFRDQSLEEKERQRTSALNFRSPQQLQEYLFSEAANAKHILKDNNQNTLRVDDSRKKHRESIRQRRLNNYVELKVKNVKNQIPDINDIHNFESSRFTRRQSPGTNFPAGNLYLCQKHWSKVFPREFKLNYPYDRKLYETSLYHEPNWSRKPQLGEDVIKLKKMVDELDSLAKESKETLAKKEMEKREKVKNETIIDVREKIDKIIIPMLTKIAKDLNVNGTKKTEIQETEGRRDTEFKKAEDARNTETKKDTKTELKSSKKELETKKESETKDVELKKETETKKNTESNDKESEIKKDFPCRLNGIWVGTSESLQLNITTLPNMSIKVAILSDGKKGAGITKDWTISGLTLATLGGPFMFAAVYPEKKKIANFVGQCRTCHDEDLIFGLWTYSTCAKDCMGMMTSMNTRLDIFRREKGQQGKGEKTSKSLTESLPDINV